jgi:hypothetical protein
VVAVSSKILVFFVKGSLKFCLKVISFCEGWWRWWWFWRRGNVGMVSFKNIKKRSEFLKICEDSRL